MKSFKIYKILSRWSKNHEIFDESFENLKLLVVILEGFHHPKPLVPFLLVRQEDVEGLAIFGAEWGRTGTELKVQPDSFWLNCKKVTI